MVYAKATEIFETNINKNPNCSKNDPDHLSEHNTANSSDKSNEYGIRNLPKIFPFKPNNAADFLKESNFTRLDRWFLKSYNSKLSRSKLKSVTNISALLAGFAMVTMIELDIDFQEFFEPENESGSASENKSIKSDSSEDPISQTVLIIYALVTCLLIGVNMIALLISTCVLPQLDALSYEDLEIEPLSKFFSNQETKNELPRNFFIKKIDSFDTAHFDFPYQKFHKFVETSWICSTVVGTFLFILNVGIIAYIKLNLISKTAAYVGGAVMIQTLIIFIILSLIFFIYFSKFKVKASQIVNSKLDSNEFII